MLQGDFTPLHTLDLRGIKDKVYYKDNFPLWRNSSSKEFQLHGFGLYDNDKTKPSTMELFDTSPHMFLGGATGHGKSVSLNTIVMAGALVHPPWKVQYFLNDPKIVEFKPFALAKKRMPHLNVVAATSDPQYTISMLEYLIDVMNTRNKIFTLANVKSIDSFNKKTGLSLPMLILVLDECRAMYLNASRQKNYIDTLIAKFVSLARNSGGRAILTSQEPVDEMSSSIMKNINIRAALGCQPDVSRKTIGNTAASRNQGKRGRLVLNDNPGGESIKDNKYTVSPFIPDFPEDLSQQIEDIFSDLSDMADLVGYIRSEPLSFFDEEAPLTRDEFLECVDNNASLLRFFIGEPAFIYKGDFNLYNTPMMIESEFDTNESMNFIAVSPLPQMRFNMVAMLLANCGKVSGAEVLLRSPLKVISEKVLALGFNVDETIETNDISDRLFYDMACIYWRYIIVSADDRVFAEHVFHDTNIHQILKKDRNITSQLEEQRLSAIIDILLEPRSMNILKLPEFSEKTADMYTDCLNVAYGQYKSLDAVNKKVECDMFPPVFFVYFDFDKLRGVEVKPQPNVLDQMFDIFKIGPIYKMYIFIVSDVLSNSSSSVASAFSNLLFYNVPENSLSAYRIRDEYPENIGSTLWVYVNKKIPTRYCFKLKFPDLVGMHTFSGS